MKKLRIRKRAVWLGLGVLAVLLVVATVSRSRPAEVVVPEVVLSDTVPDPRAVGMCARNRENGAMEGEIVGLVHTEATEQQQFRVRSREHSGAEYVMPASSVQVVKCDDAEAVTIRGRAAPRFTRW